MMKRFSLYAVMLLIAAAVGLEACREKPKDDDKIELQSLRLSQQTLQLDLVTLPKGQLTVAYVPEKIDEADKALIWESDKPDVAEVSSTGEVTAKSVGQATITVSAKTKPSVTAKCTVTVTKDQMTLNGAPETMELQVGKEPQTFTITVTPTADEVKLQLAEGADQVIKVTQDNTAFTVEALMDGEATFTITASVAGYDPVSTTVKAIVAKGDIVVSDLPEILTVQVDAAPATFTFSVEHEDATVSVTLVEGADEFITLTEGTDNYEVTAVKPTEKDSPTEILVKVEKAGYNTYEATLPVTVLDADAVSIIPSTTELQLTLAAEVEKLTYTVFPEDAEVTLVNPNETTLKAEKQDDGSYNINLLTDATEEAEYELTLRAVKGSKSDQATIKVKVVTIKTKTITIGSYSFKMIYVEPGTFMMGSPETEPYRCYDETQHEVTITKGFWIAETECSYEMWQAVTGQAKPADATGYIPANNGDVKWPVSQIKYDAITSPGGFAQQLNNKASAANNLLFRLPTEAEWEYAARGGKYGTKAGYQIFAGSNVINSDIAHYANGKTEVKMPRKVNEGTPNILGILNMSGNVYEWVNDYYDENYYKQGPQTDPKGPETGTDRVIRGGSWAHGPSVNRVAYRNYNAANWYVAYSGFRIAAEDIE